MAASVRSRASRAARVPRKAGQKPGYSVVKAPRRAFSRTVRSWYTVVAWKVRHQLSLDAVPAGPAPNLTDNLILDIQRGSSASGFGHPSCKGGTPSEDVIRKLPETDPPGKKR